MSKQAERVIFLENPYDIETVFESLSVAADYDKELLFMDKLVATIRLDPEGDLTDIMYKILDDLELLKLQQIQ